MEYFDWNEEKNEKLKRERGVSFEDMVFQIQHEGPLDVIENSKKDKYAIQRMYVIEFENYVYLVPFVQDGNCRFLKTIIPNRQAKKAYLGE